MLPLKMGTCLLAHCGVVRTLGPTSAGGIVFLSDFSDDRRHEERGRKLLAPTGASNFCMKLYNKIPSSSLLCLEALQSVFPERGLRTYSTDPIAMLTQPLVAARGAAALAAIRHRVSETHP